jgi:hypothetical protein
VSPRSLSSLRHKPATAWNLNLAILGKQQFANHIVCDSWFWFEQPISGNKTSPQNAKLGQRRHETPNRTPSSKISLFEMTCPTCSVYWVDPTNKLYKTSMDRGGREIYLIFRDFYFMWLYNGGCDSIHSYLSYDSQFNHKSHQSKHAITNKQFITYHICHEFV